MTLALIDGNNFFVSCERVFNPQLIDRPVVVLSSNDACVISRSDEAKALGVPMGAPFFKWQQFFRRNHVRWQSANFTLYHDFSKRFISILSDFCPRVEAYSVDEAFCMFPQTPDSPAYAAGIRRALRRRLGLPVSIGLGGTKTRAKLANLIAKQSLSGVHYCDNAPEQIAVSDVWGIGRRLSKKLCARQITTAAALARMPVQQARRLGGVTLAKTVQELQGYPCLALIDDPDPRKNIFMSRSFGRAVTDSLGLSAAITSLTARAACKLRSERGYCHRLHILLFPKNSPVRESSIAFSGCNDSSILVRHACALIRKAYEPDAIYLRAGVCLAAIATDQDMTRRLFPPVAGNERDAEANGSPLQQAVDRLNQRFGRDTVVYAVETANRHWQPRAEARSRHYTTSWQALPVVHAGRPRRLAPPQ